MSDLGAAIIDRAHEVKNAYRHDHLSEPERFRVSPAAEAAIRDELKRHVERTEVTERVRVFGELAVNPDGPMQLWGLPVEVDEALTGTEIEVV